MMNVGSTDRVVRLLVGIAILAYFFFTTWSAWGYLGFVVAATGLFGYCPLYSLLRINTIRPTAA